MKNLVKIMLLSINCFIITAVYAQDKSALTAKQAKTAAKETAIKTAVENQDFIFKADYVLPFRGGQRYLTSDYDLRIVKDSVIAFLPYFGQVYMNPPMNPEDAGVNFTSTKFDYTSALKKKGGWSVTIVPKNDKYTTKMILDIFTNGSATLYVRSNNRDPITFTGYVKIKE